MIPTPTDTEITAAIKGIIQSAFDGVVFDEWKLALVQGENLNLARMENGHARALMLALFSQTQTRTSDVPYEPAAAVRLAYKRDCTWTYRFRYVEGYSDKVDGDGKSSNQLFSERIQLLLDAFSRAPKLGLSAHVEQHDELQVPSRTIPAYGKEHAHTAEMTLTIHLFQSIQPSS